MKSQLSMHCHNKTPCLYLNVTQSCIVKAMLINNPSMLYVLKAKNRYSAFHTVGCNMAYLQVTSLKNIINKAY